MYNDLIQFSSMILSILAIISVVVVSSVSLFLKIRKYFLISVNCWFCNGWTKVCYENRNSFDCPACQQYNGFTKDGSYNKVIEAQHNTIQEKKHFMVNTFESSNGFCNSCNHNQQLKITQLANFTPLKEENYDIEIEHFKNQLEKAYRLCKPCRMVLKSTLLREKATIFGNHVFNILKKHQNIYNKSSVLISTNFFLLKLFKTIQGCLAFIVILYIVLENTPSDQQITDFSSNYLLPYYELFRDLLIVARNLLQEVNNSLLESLIVTFEHDPLKCISSIGFLLQTYLFMMESSMMTVRINQLLCWSFLLVTSWATEEVLFYTHLFQVFCATIVFYNSFYGFDTNVRVKKTFQKISNNMDKEWDECSDEELDISSQSTRSFYSPYLKPLDSSTNQSLTSSRTNTSENLSLNKTENRTFTANNIFDTSFNTANSSRNAFLYSNIRTSLEDLHLGNRRFKLERTSPLSLNRPPSYHPKLILSPPKLKTVTQNSWVAGGFWRNEDGSFVPPNDDAPLSRSSSQSSGFGSQFNEHNSTNPNNPFNSLPTSRKNSLCGDMDRYSLASEPPYHFQPVSPQPIWPSHGTSCRSSFVNAQSNNSVGHIYKTSSQNFNEFILPTTNRITSSVPLYTTSNSMGLFKLPQASTNLGTDCSSIYKSNAPTLCPTNPFLL